MVRKEGKKWGFWHRLGLAAGICFLVMACGRSDSKIHLEEDAHPEVSETGIGDYTSSEKREGEEENSLNGDEDIQLAIAASASIHFPEVLECSDGTRIHITNYGDSTLGTDRELIAACQLGTISMVSADPISHSGIVPEIALLDIPYLYDRPEEWREAMEKKLFDWFQPYYNAKGLQLVAWRSWYCRSLLSRVKVEGVEQFAGLQMRVLENDYLQNYWESMGIHTVQLPFDSLIYALNQNQVNISDSGPRSLYHTGLLPTMKYEIEVEYIPSISGIVMNLDAYNQLTPAQKEAIATLPDYQQVDHSQADSYLDECGVEKIYPDDEMKKYLRDHQYVVIDQLKEELGEALVEEFLEMARQ